MAKAKPAKIRAARKTYVAAKRAYKKAGKAAFKKSKASKVYKTYRAAKRKYRTAGSTLGRMTGVR